MPDLKANISEENLLALTSSSGNSSDDTTGLNLNRDDDASQSCQILVQLSKKQMR